MFSINSPAWLGTLRRYLLIVTLLNACWEILQLPLYTLWTAGSNREIAFAVLHCTAGDLLIAMGCVFLSLLMAGSDEWPKKRFKAVALITIGLGAGRAVAIYPGFRFLVATPAQSEL